MQLVCCTLLSIIDNRQRSSRDRSEERLAAAHNRGCAAWINLTAACAATATRRSAQGDSQWNREGLLTLLALPLAAKATCCGRGVLPNRLHSGRLQWCGCARNVARSASLRTDSGCGIIRLGEVGLLVSWYPAAAAIRGAFGGRV